MALVKVEDGSEVERVQGLGKGVEREEGFSFEIWDNFDSCGAVFKGDSESEIFCLPDDV